MHFSISNLLLCKVEKGRISGSCQAFQLQMFVLQLIGTWSAHCCGRQAAKSAPELAAGSRSSAPPNSLSGGSRWQQARERAVLSWTTRQGSRREFLLQSSVLPPAQLSLVSILHGKSPTCMLHAHACFMHMHATGTRRGRKTKNPLGTKYSESPVLLTAWVLCSPRPRNGVPCGSLFVACTSLLLSLPS